ncbi:glutathione S-transferase C-terminal domain-containing protein, partial [Rhizobiaceae bacterium]|nr:glutathione S-transferase C-terminal domain-containing protein [Rhizobiaceae bacterium]
RNVWPADQAARSHARSASSEMHSGFTALRGACPMNLTKLFAAKDRGDGVADDIERLISLWREAWALFGTGGRYLYGAFSGADAMFAPVCSRLRTYAFDLPDDIAAYVDAIHEHPAFLRWRDAAIAEPWALPHYEEGETPTAVLYDPTGAKA